MVSLKVGDRTTEIRFGPGCWRELLSDFGWTAENLTVISDERVAELWKGSVLSEALWLTFPPGEGYKTLSSAAQLWSSLVSEGCYRGRPIIALGGGVVTDLAGFVAATYLRGVPLLNIPTTLLGMVDAAVGGKVGLDLPEGKNLVGAFYPARGVAIDPTFLSTLGPALWGQGMAEVLKHGLIKGGSLWARLNSWRPDIRKGLDPLGEELLEEAVKVKIQVVSEDPFEQSGKRALLNLGHTFAHALEWSSNYALPHGDAVALGLLGSMRLSRRLGRLTEDVEEDLCSLLDFWGLPSRLPEQLKFDCRWQRIQLALSRDKKTIAGRLTFILPKAPGAVEAHEVTGLDFIREAFESLGSVRGEVSA